MKRLISKAIILSICLTCTLGSAQTRRELTRRLDENKQQIELSKKVLSETLSRKTTTLKTLSIYENQIQLREQGLRQAQKNLDGLEIDIVDAKDEIRGITQEIERIKAEFSEAIILSYKNNKKMSKMHYVFMSNSFNDLIRRLNFLKRIMDYRRLQLQLIENKKQENSVKINELVNKQGQLKISLKEKEDEAAELRTDQEQYHALVQNLIAKEDQILEEIQRREKRSADLEASIRHAINNETRSESVPGFFPGNLPWPVKNGFISERFGRHKHEDFKNVSTQNNGINITCEDNSAVHPVFEGAVSAILQVPGMQTSVLIRHGSYYTVYANLSEVTCIQGEKVSPSAVIGRVGKNQENISELHFEIWKGVTKLNPESWIRK